MSPYFLSGKLKGKNTPRFNIQLDITDEANFSFICRVTSHGVSSADHAGIPAAPAVITELWGETVIFLDWREAHVFFSCWNYDKILNINGCLVFKVFKCLHFTRQKLNISDKNNQQTIFSSVLSFEKTLVKSTEK